MTRTSPLYRLSFALAIIGIAVGTGLRPVLADDAVSVTATVVNTGGQPPNPTVEFKGRASPATDITVSRDGTEIATATTDTQARFDITLVEQPAGQHTYEIGAKDSNGLTHPGQAFALNLALGSVTIISGVFLGPTIAIDHESVKLGQPVDFTGMTVPNGSVTLSVHSTPRSYSVTADSSGRWERSVNTTDIGAGNHSASAMSLASDNTISEDSMSVAFVVNPLEPCDGKPRADLNCDGRVNLTDFSVLLFFWLTVHPQNARADINNDGQVTITDFSIMLFQWTD